MQIKKSLFLTGFTVMAFSILGMLGVVNAAPGAPWVEGVAICSEPKVPFPDLTFNMTSEKKSSLIKLFSSYCASSPDITVQPNYGPILYVCQPGEVPAKLIDDPIYIGGGSVCQVFWVIFESIKCCPADRPNLIGTDILNTGRCLSDSELNAACINHQSGVRGELANVTAVRMKLGGSVSPWVKWPPWDPKCNIAQYLDEDFDCLGWPAGWDYTIEVIFQDPNPYFSKADTKTYICGGDNCLIKAGQIDSTYYGKSLTETAISSNGYTCIKGDTSMDPGTCYSKANDCICKNGASISQEFYDRAGDTGIELMQRCLSEPSEQTGLCQDCMIRNWEDPAEGGHYSWSSSLGCIDTRMNPFITRVIQIGLGIGSGIAVVRIIQGAFLRQTNDPSKIQEGNEIIVTTIIALITLAGASVLLEILGVNILGIFTRDGFANILGG